MREDVLSERHTQCYAIGGTLINEKAYLLLMVIIDTYCQSSKIRSDRCTRISTLPSDRSRGKPGRGETSEIYLCLSLNRSRARQS